MKSLGEKNKDRAVASVIFASGGVIRRDAAGGPEVLLIHRSRYGDWCLPKGKLKERESFEEAAIREIFEETGCNVKIEGFAGTSSYRVKGKPKLVHFWNMTVQGECDFKKSEEVDRVEWLSIPHALKRLDYPEEKKILLSVFSGGNMTGTSLFVRVYRWFGRRRRQRLAGSIAAYRVELQGRITIKNEGNKPEKRCWPDAAFTLLDQAQEALKDNRLEEGWKFFNAAQRMALFSLDEGEVRNMAVLLRQEAEKLGEWRKKATYELLGKPDEEMADVNHSDVYQAALLRDEHFGNVYYKIGMLQDQLSCLIALLAVLVFVIFLMAYKGLFPLGESKATQDPNMLLSVFLTGLLGANISAIFSLMAARGRFKIPEAIAAFLVTVMRVSIGGVGALAIYFLFGSEIYTAVFKIQVTSSNGFLALAFVSGFSERLVKGALDSVIKAVLGEEKKQDSKESASPSMA